MILVVVLTITPLVVPPVPSVAAFKYLQEGMTAPTAEGKDLVTGEKASSESKTGGGRHTTCVAFWATWSPRSLELLADLKELSARLADHPLRIIAVNVDSQVTTQGIRERVGAAVEELAPPFPVIMDKDLELFYEYGVIAVPSVAVLDADHVVIDEPSGYSYSVRDRLVETIEISLGLRDPEEAAVVTVARYRPKARASRYYHLSVQLANQRHYESALENLALSMEIDPRFSAPFNLRGHIEMELGETESAIESFNHAIELDSTSVAARAGLGRAQLHAGDTTAALEQLEIALALEPSYPAALLDLGRCLAARQEPDRAIAVLEEAVALNPRDSALYYYLGRVYREYGRTPEAIRAYRIALEMRFPRP
jgi:tetratricopeptide (TPR) repeat protein